MFVSGLARGQELFGFVKKHIYLGAIRLKNAKILTSKKLSRSFLSLYNSLQNCNSRRKFCVN